MSRQGPKPNCPRRSGGGVEGTRRGRGVARAGEVPRDTGASDRGKCILLAGGGSVARAAASARATARKQGRAVVGLHRIDPGVPRHPGRGAVRGEHDAPVTSGRRARGRADAGILRTWPSRRTPDAACLRSRRRSRARPLARSRRTGCRTCRGLRRRLGTTASSGTAFRMEVSVGERARIDHPAFRSFRYRRGPDADGPPGHPGWAADAGFRGSDCPGIHRCLPEDPPAILLT